jgi:ATP-dependent Clp protease ATP-binding subunit ClpC
MEVKKNETLEKFATNVTNKAINGELDRVFGREKELEDMCKILSRKKKNNVVLVGFPGVGKTDIVNLLCQRIVDQKVPYGLLNKTIYSLDAASITAGTQYRGQMEERLKKIMQEAEDDENVILFIDETHSILDNGSSNSLNIANIMKPHLSTGKLQVIGATTFDEYKKFFEKDGALSRRFNKLVIDEPSEESCVEIIKKCISSYEEFHLVKFPEEIINKIPSYAKKYIKDRYLPDSAIDIIDELGAKLKVEKTKPSTKLLKMLDEMEEVQAKKIDLIKNEKWDEISHFKPNVLDKLRDKIANEQNNYISKIQNVEKTEITEEDLLKVVATISKVPIDKLNKDGKSNIKKLEDVLNRELINQDDAKNKVLRALKKRVLNLNNVNKPVSYLFLGKTGSGKSFISKLIAEHWFDGSLIRFDMGEFQDKISSTSLLGSSPGYIGYEEGGNLTEQVKRNPFSLILFDEIEKANKDILNILLTILDEGYCTDAKGRKVDFKNCIIIMTSNLGAKDSEYKKPSYGGGKNVNLNNTSVESAKKHFSPELWNRIDEVVVFNPLTKDDMYKILDIEIEKFKKMLKNRGVNLNINKKVRDYLVEKGFDENLGARPLKRTFENLLVDEIVDVLIYNDDVKKMNVIMDDDNVKILVNVL